MNTVLSHVVLLRKRHYCGLISNVALNVLVKLETSEKTELVLKPSVAYQIKASPVVLF